MDLLVVPSIREPLGNVCFEARLCKIPVLAANINRYTLALHQIYQDM